MFTGSRFRRDDKEVFQCSLVDVADRSADKGAYRVRYPDPVASRPAIATS